ncbi:unnamed protein product [Ilex paraguariensis]|uniref:Metallo-beta-lactamase domain-containing protein n=1 Tax=Ilex paraguariensis TaxID=185542 RepID=A0ABC8T9V6_9AQUA
MNKRAVEEEEEIVAKDLLLWGHGDGDGDDYCSSNTENEEEAAFSLVGLDDYGMPSFQLSTPERHDDQQDFLPLLHPTRSSETNKPAASTVVDAEQYSFASDFYRCGTDWSCLLFQNDNINRYSNNNGEEDHKNLPNSNPMSMSMSMAKDNKKRKLIQANLFQIWGFQKDNNIKSSNNGGDDFDTSAGYGNSINEVASHHHHQQHRPRFCSFYKKIPGTPFTVDAFRYGCVKDCSAYFLTHFHADHYGGLTKGWSHGLIYCTPLTACLVRMYLSINSTLIRPLQLGTEYVIEGSKVTLLDANHCPGAALIYIRLPNGQCYLHTGDFRASRLMQSYPLLANHRINVLYLDTTYCNPKYKFPPKDDVLNFVVRVTKHCLKKQPKTLVIVGAYSIGKECVYLAISKALGVKIYTNASRRRILQCFGWSEIAGKLCTQGKDTPLHVLPISSLRFEILERYLKTYMSQYTAVLAFRPTGWTYTETVGSHLDLIKPVCKGIVTIYGEIDRILSQIDKTKC